MRDNVKNSLLEMLSFSAWAHLNGSASSVKLPSICVGESGCWSMEMV